MHVIVYCNEGPDSGLVYLRRALGDQELLTERRFADEVALTLGVRIADADGHIPNCCGDLRVEFTDHEPHVIGTEDGERYQGSVRIWSGKSYYFSREDS